MFRLILASSVGALALATVACGGGKQAAPPPTHTLNGTVALVSQCKTSCTDAQALPPDAAWKPGEPCAGNGDYADMKAGGTVTVKNGAGAVIGTGQLGAGVGTGTGYVEPGHVPYALSCDFTFAVDNIPDSDLIVVEVRRGAWTYTRSDMESSDWTVHLTDDSNVGR